MVNMVAEAVSGSKTPKEAMDRAQGARRALLQGVGAAASRLNNRHVLGLLFMLPAGVLLLLFLTYPLGLGTWLGFTDTKVGRAGRVGRPRQLQVPVGDAVARLVALQHALLHRRRERLQVRARAVAGAAAEPAHAVQVASSAPSCCCPSSCPPRSRRSPSGGSTTRSSRSSAGRS